MLIDDLLQILSYSDDAQCQMSDAEVLTTAEVAVLFFNGKIESSRWFLREQECMLRMLSKSRLNWCLHRAKHLSRELLTVQEFQI